MRISELSGNFNNKPALKYGNGHNNVVKKQVPVQELVDNLYCGKLNKEQDGIETVTLYVFYPNCIVGLPLLTLENPERYTVDELYQKMVKAYPEIISLDKFIDELEERESKGMFIGNLEIEFLKYAAPTQVQHYQLYRAECIRKNEEKELLRQKQKDEEESAFYKEKNAEFENSIQNAIEIINNNGVLHNEQVTYYHNGYDYTSYSLINYLFKRYKINIPIKVQGWIAKSLTMVIFKNGEFIQYRVLRGSNSKTFDKYFSQLVEAVQSDR